MVERISNQVEPGGSEASRVVVVYENARARRFATDCSAALAACESGGTHWCSFASLKEAAAAADAAKKAADADLIIFAIAPAGELPPQLKSWIESWVARRGDREGALVGLVNRQGAPGEMACLKEIYLRHTALRAGMDYLCHVPSALIKAMPDSPDSLSARAGQVTSVLDQILHSTSPPPAAHLGR